MQKRAREIEGAGQKRIEWRSLKGARKDFSMQATQRYIPESWHVGAVLISLIIFAMSKAGAAGFCIYVAYSDATQSIRTLEVEKLRKLLEESFGKAGAGEMVWGVVCVSFLCWFYRVHKNLYILGTGSDRFKPRWAILGFLIPVVNFVLPLVTALHINASSYLHSPQESLKSPSRADGDVRIVLWWLLICMYMALRSAILTSFSISGLEMSPVVYLVTTSIENVIQICAVLATISMVVWIERRQTARAEKIGLLPPQVATEISSGTE